MLSSIATDEAARRTRNNFANSKAQCLGKRDKSSAGRIDPRAVDICAVLNARDVFYTTSSCAGRCYLYRGRGVKATDSFRRYRVSHERIDDPERYFDLTRLAEEDEAAATDEAEGGAVTTTDDGADAVVWLRYEPFILHVACRSLGAAEALAAAARPAFKSVGLTAWRSGGRYLVLILGDESLEMPLTTPDGRSLVGDYSCRWLAAQVNERHERNWSKIERFVAAARHLAVPEDDECIPHTGDYEALLNDVSVPRSFDVIGDVAVVNELHTEDILERQRVGAAIIAKNKAIKLVVARDSTLKDAERAPGSEGLVFVAGIQRSPIITTHCEYGIKCVVDLEHTFFTPRMASERLRICQQVGRNENILVLFCGVGMEAFHIAARTEASSVLAIDINSKAIQCALRGKRMLERNSSVKVPRATERLEILEGNVLDVLPTLAQGFYDRALVPRPKEGAKDGDLGDGLGGVEFLKALLPLLKSHAYIHWFDFVADHEYPSCTRSCQVLSDVCDAHGFDSRVLHVAKLQSVAMRQLRVCIDMQLDKREVEVVP